MAFDRQAYERERSKRRTANGEFRASYAQRRESILATCAEKRVGSGGDRVRAVQRAYVRRNKAVISARLKTAGFKHQKAWKAANREQTLFGSRELVARRIAERRGSVVEKVDYRRIWHDSDRTCGICHQLVDFADLSFDHKVPLSRGGPHVAANIQIAHGRCNSSKGAKVAA